MKYTPRQAWGGPARAPGHETAGAKLLVVLHHAYRPHIPCGVARWRERDAMLGMHRYALQQGWDGFSYQWAAFQSGEICEGRGWGRTGAHTVGRNSSSQGIVIVIDGESHSPSEAAIDAVRTIIADGVERGHIAREHEVAPHDQFQNKVCPGKLVKVSGLLGHGLPVVIRDAAIAPQPTLRRGSGGPGADADIFEAVLELQRRLVALGFMQPQHLTGGFFDITDAAVRAYQSAHGLKDDGIVGPKTWAVLLR